MQWGRMRPAGRQFDMPVINGLAFGYICHKKWLVKLLPERIGGIPLMSVSESISTRNLDEEK